MPKYIYARDVTEEELSELQSFKEQGTRELVRGRIIELSVSGKHPKEISESVEQIRRLFVEIRYHVHWKQVVWTSLARLPYLVTHNYPGSS